MHPLKNREKMMWHFLAASFGNILKGSLNGTHFVGLGSKLDSKK